MMVAPFRHNEDHQVEEESVVGRGNVLHYIPIFVHIVLI